MPTQRADTLYITQHCGRGQCLTRAARPPAPLATVRSGCGMLRSSCEQSPHSEPQRRQQLQPARGGPTAQPRRRCRLQKRAAGSSSSKGGTPLPPAAAGAGSSGGRRGRRRGGRGLQTRVGGRMVQTGRRPAPMTQVGACFVFGHNASRFAFHLFQCYLTFSVLVRQSWLRCSEPCCACYAMTAGPEDEMDVMLRSMSFHTAPSALPALSPYSSLSSASFHCCAVLGWGHSMPNPAKL